MKYYIIAGEASGELHGSHLREELYAQDPEAEVRFWGRERMEAVMGFLEVLRKARVLSRTLRQCKEDIAAWQPDVVILVDYPGFNFKIAEFAHKAGLKVYWYIAPKLWASREGRIRRLKAWVDRLYIIFPFEQAYFARRGVPCTYVGNPLLDALDGNPALAESREAFLARTGLPDRPLVALLAGSRSMEIGQMMPVFMQVADAWHTLHPEQHFVLAAAPGWTAADYAGYIQDRDFVHVVCGETYGALRHAQAAVINSGTASLEAALIGTPQVVTYRMSPISAWIARRLIRVPYVSLVNLILDRPAVKELLQGDFTRAKILEELDRLVLDPACRSAFQADYALLRAILGNAGASRAIARDMIKQLKQAKQPNE